MMKTMGNSFWICRECEESDNTMKSVVDSINSIKKGQEEQKAELIAIKKGQEEGKAERAEQQTEREKVIEGLKAVEVVAKKLEQIEVVQEAHDKRLKAHDELIKNNKLKAEEDGKRIKTLEDQIQNTSSSGDPSVGDLRQCNAVAKEVRELEKREKNLVFFNVPEASEQENDEVERKVNDGAKS